jgi:biopolymer transport protein ExbB
LFDFLASGGPVMIPIGLASVIGLGAFIERLWALRRHRVVPHGVRVELGELARQSRWADALTLCRKSDSPLSRVLEVIVAHRGQTRAELKELSEEIGRREAAELERYSGIVGVVAAVSPLLGLLGTVWGMILTFDVIQSEGVGVVSSLAGGISAALVTTFAGLSVGIPTLIAHRYLLSKVDDLVLDLEDCALEMLDLVTGMGADEPREAAEA